MPRPPRTIEVAEPDEPERWTARRLIGERLAAPRWTDLVLESCDLAGLVTTGGTLRRCVLRDCRLTGAVWADGEIEDVRFVGCRLDLLGLRGTRLRHVAFDGCDLREAEFDGARVERVRFDGCDLTRASFAGARCARAELRRCTLEELRGLAGLRGARLEPMALVELAPELARLAGIELLAGEDDAADRR